MLPRSALVYSHLPEVLNGIAIKYLDLPVFSGSFYSLLSRFPEINYREAEEPDLFIDYALFHELNHFGELQGAVVSRELFSTFGGSTVCLECNAVTYPVLHSSDYIFLFGHPEIPVLSKFEVRSFFEFINPLLVQFYDTQLVPKMYPITQRAFVSFWFLSSGYVGYRDRLLKSPSSTIPAAFQAQIRDECLPSGRGVSLVDNVVSGILSEKLYVDLESVYPKKSSGCDVRVSFGLEPEDSFEWNALTMVDEHWFLVVNQWMFQVHGLTELIQDKVEFVYEELEHSLFH